MGTNSTLSVCIQLNEANNYSFPIVLTLFVFYFSLCFSAFVWFIHIYRYWRNKMSLYLMWHTFVSMSMTVIHSVSASPPWLHTYNESVIIINISPEKHSHRLTPDRQGEWILSLISATRWPFFLQFPSRKGNSIFCPYLQSKCNVWNFKLKNKVCDDFHVYNPRPKASYWWQWLDFWRKNIRDWIWSTFWRLQAVGAQHCSMLVEIWLAK